MTVIKRQNRYLLFQTHLNQTINALNPTSMLQSLSLLTHTGLFGTLLKLTAEHIGRLARMSVLDTEVDG